MWDIWGTQRGFKFFQDDMARELFADRISTARYYMCDGEILYMTRRSSHRVQQISARWRDNRDSRLDLFAGNIRNVKDFFNVQFT